MIIYKNIDGTNVAQIIVYFEFERFVEISCKVSEKRSDIRG
jgi:hypothetical protein